MITNLIFRIFFFCLILTFLNIKSVVIASDSSKIEIKQTEYKINKYIDNDVHYKMPEEEFIKMFTKKEDWQDKNKPYIIKHKKNYYVLKEPDVYFFGITQGGKIKVTFENRKLVKLVSSGWEGLPIFRLDYDCTHFLKYYEIQNGLYVGMPEKEFLHKFSNRTMAKAAEGYYALVMSDGSYRVVSFNDGILTSAYLTDEEDWKGWQKYLIHPD